MRYIAQCAQAACFMLVAAPAIAAAPTIVSFSPTIGPITTKITITGTAFTGATAVTIGGVAAKFTVTSATVIAATLPATATGPIRVTTAGGTAVTTANFNVTPGALVSLSRVHPGGAFTTTASGMDPYTAIDVYFDTGDAALAVSNASGIATVAITAPATASPGTHWITFDERSTHKAAQTALTIGTDWVQAAFSPTNSGYNPFEGTLSPATAPTLDSLWAAPDGGYGNATPLVEFGGTLFAGDVLGVVRAYTAATGALLWTANPGGWLAQRNPVVYAGNVYFSNATNIFAYSATCGTGGATCKPVWTQTFAAGPYGGLSLFGTSLYIGGADGNIYPVNPATGALGTPFHVYDNTSGAITSAVSFSPDGSYGYVANGSTLEYAFANGSLNKTSNGNGVSPLAYIGNAGFYETGDGMLHEAGGQMWSAALSGTSCYPQPAVASGEVFAGDCSNVSAFSAGTGTTLWIANVGGPVSGITVANNVVYACANYAIIALGAAYGQQLWAGGYCSGAPVVANGSVYSNSGLIYAFTIPALAGNVPRQAPPLSRLKPDFSLAAQRTPNLR